METDYRQQIQKITDRYAEPGEDWEQILFAGSPAVIDATEARRIAYWLDSEADNEWGEDPRHHDIADEIRALIKG